MASVSKRKNGTRVCQYVDPKTAVRKTIYLGKTSNRNARLICTRVEQIIAANRVGHAFPSQLQDWLDELDEDFHQKLSRHGLVAVRPKPETLVRGIDRFIESKKTVKNSTKSTYARAKKHLIDFFGGEHQLTKITSEEAIAFVEYLYSTGLSKNTVRRTSGIARQIFKSFAKQNLVKKNPFVHEEIPTQTGESDGSRKFFVTRDLANQILAVLPNLQWKLVFILARFGGLRFPSEALLMKWNDIDFESSRITIRSPKTEHIVGRDHRIIPLYPELRQTLLDAFEERENSEFVISLFRDSNSSYATRFSKLLKSKGIKCWKKPFQNMRSSRQTELLNQGFSLKVVCEWMGNSDIVALKHYLQVTDNDFKKATQFETQQVTELTRSSQKTMNPIHPHYGVFPSDSVDCVNLPFVEIGRAGLEQHQNLRGLPPIP